MPDVRSPSHLRLLVAVAAMTSLMLVVVLVGQYLLIPSDTVRGVDAAGVSRGTGLLADRPWLVDLARVWSAASGPWFVHPLVLLLGIVLLRAGRVRARALLTFVIALIGTALGLVAKEIVARPRPLPENPIVEYSSWSYPSGHATNIALAAVLLIALLGSVHRAWIRWSGTVLVLLGTALTSADRIALGVHYISDVAAGLALGATMALAGLAILIPDGVAER